jgi:hypothetical protein
MGGPAGAEGGEEDSLTVVAVSNDRTLYEPLINTPLLPINASHEFLSSCAIQTIATLILFDHSHDSLFLFYQYELLFQETPLCEATLYLMLQHPHHAVIQTKGLFVLHHLLRNQISVAMLSACFERVLCQLMEIHGEETSLHSAFLHFLLLLTTPAPAPTAPGGGRGGGGQDSERSERNKWTILHSTPLMKWIVVVMRYLSPENGPLACELISVLATGGGGGGGAEGGERQRGGSDRSGETAGAAWNNPTTTTELCQVIIQLLEKHECVLRVQVEGVKTLCLLGQKSLKCLRQIRASRGERVIQKSRQYLREVLSACEEGMDQLEHTSYSKEDLLETIQLSNPKRFAALCNIS